MTSPSIPGYSDFQLPFLLNVDACSTGLGAALYEVHNGRPAVIAYGSRTLSPGERNYSAYCREFLALNWAVGEKFRHYLYGSKFHVTTDSNPLTYLVPKAKLSPTDHRWLSSLAVFDFDISYRAAKANGDADGLSCMPSPDPQENKTGSSDDDFLMPFLQRVKPMVEDENTCTHESQREVFQTHFLEISNDDAKWLPAVEVVSAMLKVVDNDLPIDPLGGEPLSSSYPVNWAEL